MTPPSVAKPRTAGELYAQPAVGISRADSAAVLTDACPVCGEQRCRPCFALPGLPFRIMKCTACGTGALWPRPDAGAIRAFYPQHYYGSEGRKFFPLIEQAVRLVAARHARFFGRLMPPGARVLDVGCGRGVTLAALAEAGFETWGFEVSAEAVQGVNPPSQIRVAESLAEAGFPDQFFDEIIIWHVLEHVPDPRVMAAELHRLLRAGGVLIVAVPNFSSWQARFSGAAWFHLDPPRHLFHFPLPALKQLLQEAGFRIRSEHHFSLRQNPFGWIQSVQNLCGWLPRNGLYVLLHRLQQGAEERFAWWIRLQLWIFCILLAPMSVLLSILEALGRQGATVHVVAVRDP